MYTVGWKLAQESRLELDFEPVNLSQNEFMVGSIINSLKHSFNVNISFLLLFCEISQFKVFIFLSVMTFSMFQWKKKIKISESMGDTCTSLSIHHCNASHTLAITADKLASHFPQSHTLSVTWLWYYASLTLNVIGKKKKNYPYFYKCMSAVNIFFPKCSISSIHHCQWMGISYPSMWSQAYTGKWYTQWIVKGSIHVLHW